MADPSLDEVLSDDYDPDKFEAKEEETPTEPEPAEEETTGEAEEVPEEEPKAEEPPSSEPKDDRIPITALLDERDKRQRAERELEALKNAQPQEPEKKVDPIEDPEGFQEQINQQLKAQAYQIERRFMAKMHEDWDEAEAWINEQIPNNQAIQAKLQGSDSILEDAYSLWTQHKQLEQLGSVETLQQQLEATQKELEALKAGQPAPQVEKPETPAKPSIASAGSSTSIEVEGVMSLEDVLGSDFNQRSK